MTQQVLYVATVVTAGLGLAIAVGLVALAQGYAAAKAFEAIARQPESQGVLTRVLFVALAMLESLAIYMLVLALILLFANPLLSKAGP
jgi:F-type H+-transporting ATPase subunit c